MIFRRIQLVVQHDALICVCWQRKRFTNTSIAESRGFSAVELSRDFKIL